MSGQVLAEFLFEDGFGVDSGMGGLSDISEVDLAGDGGENEGGAVLLHRPEKYLPARSRTSPSR